MVKLIVLIFLAMLFQARPANAQMGMTPLRQGFEGQVGTAEATNQEKSENHEASLDDVLAEILSSQQVESTDQMDCGNVLDDQFERLGDAWMETMHPGKSHEYMERMMARLSALDSLAGEDSGQARLPALERSDSGQGGEDSASLRSSHITMGQRYLGCRNDLRGRGWHTSMMGMMGGWGGYGGSMTGLWFFWLVSWVLVNILLIALIRYFWKKGSSTK